MIQRLSSFSLPFKGDMPSSTVRDAYNSVLDDNTKTAQNQCKTIDISSNSENTQGQNLDVTA